MRKEMTDEEKLDALIFSETGGFLPLNIMKAFMQWHKEQRKAWARGIVENLWKEETKLWPNNWSHSEPTWRTQLLKAIDFEVDK